MSFKVIGTGTCLPQKVVTNDDLSEFVDTSDEWIFPRTGIKRRHVCTTETLDDLAISVAQKAVEMSGIDPGQIGLVVCSTTSSDHPIPSVACVVAGSLGIECPAYDVYIACSGFVHGLEIADGYFARGRAKYALVLSAEKCTRLVDWSDRSTCVLFGDGAGAAVIEATDDESLPMRGWTKAGFELTLPGQPSKSPYDQHPADYGDSLAMNGRAIFRFAVKAINKEVKALAAEAGIDYHDIDHYIFHQANERILSFAVDHLGIDNDKVVRTIQETGNISSACIPIAMDKLNREGKLHDGDLLCLVGFGGGLSVGSCLIRWQS